MLKVAIYLWYWLTFPSLPPASTVQWFTPQAVTVSQYADLEKPLLIDVYTSWCHYCKLMDATAWKHKSLVPYVNEHFIPVKFNAESKDSLQWMSKTYRYEARFKVHQLAMSLLNGNMVYPSLVIIPPKGDPQVIRGAYSAAELELLLKYYGSGAYRETPFTAYQQSFSRTWK